jgi:hypothetical protein
MQGDMVGLECDDMSEMDVEAVKDLENRSVDIPVIPP